MKKYTITTTKINYEIEFASETAMTEWIMLYNRDANKIMFFKDALGRNIFLNKQHFISIVEDK